MNASRLMIRVHAREAGWDESSQIDLLTRFIDELGDGQFLNDFDQFLITQAKEEQEMSIDE